MSAGAPSGCGYPIIQSRHASDELGEPLMSSTLILPGDPQPLTHGLEIQERLESAIDAFWMEATAASSRLQSSISPSSPEIVREGKGLEPLIGLAAACAIIRARRTQPASGKPCLFSIRSVIRPFEG